MTLLNQSFLWNATGHQDVSNPYILAPELLRGEGVPCCATDVYAFGILASEGNTKYTRAGIHTPFTHSRTVTP